MQKKGFTLIELLAVLVILAILALITVPIVMGIIKNAREASYKRSIEAYGRDVQNSILLYEMEHNTELPTSLSSYDIKTSGNIVICDKKIKGIKSDDGITLTNCYVADKDGNRKSKRYKYQNGKLIEGTIFDEYQVGDTITLLGDDYYVIASSGISQDYVTALKAEPLTVAEANKYGTGHINRYTYEEVGIPYDSHGYGGVQYYSSETCGFIVPGDVHSLVDTGCLTDYNQSEIKYIINTWADGSFKQNELVADKYDYKARLITVEELKQLGYVINEYDYYPLNDNVPSWVYNSQYWYWVIGSYDSNNSELRYVFSDGEIRSVPAYGSGGTIRPVVNVLKSALE